MDPDFQFCNEKNLGQTLNSLGFELFWVHQKSLLYQDFVDFEALSGVARGMIGTVGTLSGKINI